MPAVVRHVVDANPLHHAVSLVQRQNYPGRERKALTPTAIAVVVPLFVAIAAALFFCVWRTRKRGRPQPPPPKKKRTVAERREDAREKLIMVTEVSTVTANGNYACNAPVQEDQASADSVSMLDKDCAICLSSLHSPSPPEPAKLADEGVAEVKPPSVLEQEEILRLKICDHEFHAECLISWVVLRKYSCPICRAVFFEPEVPKPEGSEGHELRELNSAEAQPSPPSQPSDPAQPLQPSQPSQLPEPSEPAQPAQPAAETGRRRDG